MAIASLHVSVVSRGKGRSAVAAAAYRAGEQLYNAYEGQTYDYSRRSGVVYAEVFAPGHAPEWATDRAALWNAVETVEKQSNSRLARQIEFALPHELTREQTIALATDYAKQFVQDGMVADLAIHDKGDGNPHAHILLTTRPFDPDGNWGEKSRKEYILDNNGDRIRLASGQWKSRKVDAVDWNQQDNVEKWREQYADLTNQYLERYGCEDRIDHRSYERQGVDRDPTIHLGHYAHQLEQQGIETERGDINREIDAQNQQREAIQQELEQLEREHAQLRQELHEEERRDQRDREETDSLHHERAQHRAIDRYYSQTVPPQDEKSAYRQRYDKAKGRYQRASQTQRTPRPYQPPREEQPHRAIDRYSQPREPLEQPHHTGEESDALKRYQKHHERQQRTPKKDRDPKPEH